MQDLKIALLQSDLSWEAPASNLAHFSDQLARVPDGIDLIVLPEMFSTGFSMAAARLGQPMDGPTIAWLQEHSRQTRADIVQDVFTTSVRVT